MNKNVLTSHYEWLPVLYCVAVANVAQESAAQNSRRMTLSSFHSLAKKSIHISHIEKLAEWPAAANKKEVEAKRLNI